MTDLEIKLSDENGKLKRGREVQRLKIREIEEELQRLEENQIDVMRFDIERDERDMAIADELNSIKIHPPDLVIEIDSIKIIQDIIKQLRGE